MRVFLVDFENVKSDGLRCVDCLSEGDQVITFFSKNAESLSMDTYFNLVGSKASFYAVRLDRTGSNALDFQLVAYLGYLMGTPEHQDVYVISKDHGFYSAATFCRNFLIPQSKYKKTVTQYPSIASLFPNHVESRPAAINSIPLFMNGDHAVKQAPIAVQEPVEEKEQPIPVKAEEAEVQAAPIVITEQKEAPKAEELHTAAVSPKRREVKVGKHSENKTESRQNPPKEEKPRSDWDEISAAAEAGLQIIDMFSGNEPIKKEVKAVKPVKEEKKAVQSDEIEIIDLFAPVEAAKKAEPIKQEPVKQEPVKQEPVKQEEPIPQPVEAEMPSVTPQLTEATLSGAEIDKMLEEFLEEAAAVIEQELKSMPAAEELPTFIEVAAAEEPVQPEKPVQETSEPEKPKRTGQRKNDSRKPRQPAKSKQEEVKPAAAEDEAKPEEAPAKNKRVSKKTSEKYAADAQTPKQAEKPEAKKEQPTEKSAEQPAVSKDGAMPVDAARQHIKKVLCNTLEIEEEAKDDLEKLIDCILDASGKQDLYRMIIKLFGQKTGLEYYKVVKREYTNICNQIGKK